jgi:ribosomal protein S18 acetylase RimI-like enzyme
MMISKLQPDDYHHWLPLWQANMEHSVSDTVTAETWQRICDPHSTVNGLCSRDADHQPITGICHFITHATTGNIKPVCYMQDLYVDPAHRRKGIARKLVTYLAALGTTQEWARIYWLAESKNEAAQQLYQSLGLKLDFTLHVLPL